MRITRTLRRECNKGDECNQVIDTDDPEYVLVQGDRVTDPAISMISVRGTRTSASCAGTLT